MSKPEYALVLVKSTISDKHKTNYIGTYNEYL